MNLEEMTTVEVTRMIEKGDAIAIVPLGSTEQHGPHLPMNTDSVIARAISRRLNERYDNSVMTPSVNVGFSEYHLGFKGTLSIPEKLLRETIVHVAKNLIFHGFRHVILIPAHGGDFQSCNDASEEINREEGENRVLSYPDFVEFMRQISLPCYEAGISEEEVGSHSGASETSLLMHVDRNLVRLDAVEKGSVGDLASLRKTMRAQGMKAACPNGVMGNPEKAKAEYGEKAMENVITLLTDYFRKDLGK